LQRDRGGNQARIARSAQGQDGAGGGKAARGPPLSAARFWLRFRRIALWGGYRPWIWLFSIHGQEQGHLGRIEAQADHVENLLDAANAGH
jgi:hypothetical protein